MCYGIMQLTTLTSKGLSLSLSLSLPLYLFLYSVRNLVSEINVPKTDDLV